MLKFKELQDKYQQKYDALLKQESEFKAKRSNLLEQLNIDISSKPLEDVRAELLSKLESLEKTITDLMSKLDA